MRPCQQTHSPVSCDWHTVSPRSDRPSSPETQSSPNLVANSLEDATAYTMISVSPPLDTGRDQDKVTNTVSINGELQDSGALIKGGNAQPVTPSSGACTLSSQALLQCLVEQSYVKGFDSLFLNWNHFLKM